MKKALTMTPALSYYDVMKPVVIQYDASDSGLGAALLQNGLPVAYSSRALTSAETNYAQIEKELLAIVFACEKFDQHVYGRDKVHVQSDHKPLEVIFKRPLVTAPMRLQRMLLRLQRYSLEVTYVRGSEMYIADTLSRAYIPGNPSVHTVTFAEIDMTEGLSVSPRRLQELRDDTASDCVLQKLIQVTLGGWPSQKSDTDLDVRACYNVRHELTVQNGLVFNDNRIEVPTSVRENIIATVHRSHQGIQGCIRWAKDAVYWPLMNQQITDYISQCSVCNTYRPEQCKEPLMPHAVPDRPWAKVGADLFELQGQHYLLLVDYYSNNFFELVRLGSNTRATCVIDAMRSQFARHGSPEVLVSDNGPQFSCREFRTFTQLWDIEHVTSNPRYPQSNGQSERAIGTVKNLMKKALEDGSDVQLALQSFRNTVLSGSLPMTTLSRYASPARLLLDLTALSVKEPTRDRCVRPPSHQRAMCIFRPRSLVNSRVHDSHLCTRLSFATAASVVALVRVVLWMCITLLFLAEMIIAASAMEPAASDVTRAVACPASSSMRAASSAYSNLVNVGNYATLFEYYGCVI